MIGNCKLIYAKQNNFKEEKILNVCVYTEQKKLSKLKFLQKIQKTLKLPLHFSDSFYLCTVINVYNLTKKDVCALYICI